MMFRLPPPPRFTLPPPPMLSADVFDTKLLFRLTCSSIRQDQYKKLTNPRLILISCITFLIIAMLFTLVFVLIQSYRRRKSLSNNDKLKASPPVIPSNHLSMSSSRSYETISSAHTGIYVESIDTSATTLSTNPSNIICLNCHQESDYSNISPPPPYYHTLDILPT
jgi:hypothetical protein